MSELVHIANGQLTTTSKQIADAFGKTHRHVLRDIEAIECSDKFRESNYGLSSYTSSQNKVLPCYEITKDGFMFIAMGFTGPKAAEWKEKYINAFNELEQLATCAAYGMEALNKAVADLTCDREVASECAKRLRAWGNDKEAKEARVEKIFNETQKDLFKGRGE